MGETGAAGFTDLCLVTAVGIEFKIAAGLLTAKSFSEEPPSERRRPCLRGSAQEHLDEPGRQGRLPSQDFSEGPRLKICRGQFGARRVTVLQSEMGAVCFAERLARHLADNRYDALIVAGLAGGLDPKLRVGDAVLYDLCYDARTIDFTLEERPAREEIRSIASDGPLSNSLVEALTRSDLSFIQAPGITVNRIVTEAKEKSALRVNYGAAAVDMETYEALAACARRDLAAVALRVISDEAGHNIPDFNRAYDADGRMHGGRMAATMIARPLVTLRLLLTIKRALQSLRANLRAAMSA